MKGGHSYRWDNLRRGEEFKYGLGCIALIQDAANSMDLLAS